MRVLVTGHLGYIGTVLVPMLLRCGYEVTGLDVDLFARCSFERGPLAIPAIKKDIRDATGNDLEGFEAVIHLAGLSNDPLGDYNPQLTHEINHLASVRLAKLAKSRGVSRFIFSSSCSNYGAAGDEMLDETGAFNPVTPYGHSKVGVEQDVSEMADSSFSPVFLRNATAYGVSPRIRFDLVVNNLVAWAFATGRVFLKSDGSAWRPLVHVEDISRAFIAVLEAPQKAIHNQAFNILPLNENYRVRDVAEIVARVVPNSRVEFAKGAEADKRNYRVDGTKISRMIPNFKPKWNVERGASELYEAYQRVGITLEEFEGPKYKRIAHVKKLIEQGLLNERLRWRGEEGEYA